VRALRERVEAATGSERVHLEGELAELQDSVRSETLGTVAAEFDAVHSIERAQKVGSVHDIVTAASLRPALIDAIERGMARTAGPGR
jgi:hypothetical protein